MRVFIRGQWYDAEEEFVAVRVTAFEKKHLADMPGDYYSQHPGKLGAEFGKSALDHAVELDRTNRETPT